MSFQALWKLNPSGCCTIILWNPSPSKCLARSNGPTSTQLPGGLERPRVVHCEDHYLTAQLRTRSGRFDRCASLCQLLGFLWVPVQDHYRMATSNQYVSDG